MGKRTRNLLIVALILVLCCFGGSIGNPFRDDDSDSNPIVDFLGNFASNATAVPDSAIQAAPASCRTGPNQFQVNSTCTLDVASGGRGIRNLVLTSNKDMNVKSRVPRKDFTVSNNVGAGKRVKVPIDERGGAVILTCAGICVVTRGDGS